MPVYEYEALTEEGEPTRGVIDADTAKEARRKLLGRKILVTSMVPVEHGDDRKEKVFELPQIFNRVSIAELTLVTRQLSTLLTAGIPLADALTVLIQQIENRRLETALRQISEDIKGGSTPADAFARHPKLFNDLFVNMIRAGEASGNLDIVLRRLSDYMQKQSRLRGRVSAALTYPVIMAIAGTGVVIFLMTFVVPKITQVILKQGSSLPLPTEILIGISNFIRDFWPMMLLAAGGVYAAYKIFTATEKGRLVRDTYLLQIPVFGELFKKQAVSRFATTFSTLHKSGIPALECLKILETVVDNQLLSNTLRVVHDRIIEGADISTPLMKSKVFPPVVGHMIAVGEQSGQLAELLDKIAETYDEEIEIATQKVTSMIEPVVIILMAGIVGFIVMAVVLPLVEGFQV